MMSDMNNATAYHDALKSLWCQWNGQKGTAKQIARIRCTAEQLERMLTERGVDLAASLATFNMCGTCGSKTHVTAACPYRFAGPVDGQ